MCKIPYLTLYIIHDTQTKAHHHFDTSRFYLFSVCSSSSGEVIAGIYSLSCFFYFTLFYCYCISQLFLFYVTSFKIEYVSHIFSCILFHILLSLPQSTSFYFHFILRPSMYTSEHILLSPFNFTNFCFYFIPHPSNLVLSLILLPFPHLFLFICSLPSHFVQHPSMCGGGSNKSGVEARHWCSYTKREVFLSCWFPGCD